MYPYLESIKVINGEPLHLEFHQERIERTCHEVYGIHAPFVLSEVLRFPSDMPSIVKCRLIYNNHSFSYDCKPYKRKNIRTIQLVSNNEIDYHVKTLERNEIDLCLSKKGECDDILIVKHGFITDSSFANIIFYDGGEWITPNTPLLAGTCRARLLKEGKIREQSIGLENLKSFDSFCLINAMLNEFEHILPISNIKNIK